MRGPAQVTMQQLVHADIDVIARLPDPVGEVLAAGPGV